MLATVLVRHIKAAQRHLDFFCIFVPVTQCMLQLIVHMCMRLSFVDYSGLNFVIEGLLLEESMRDTDLLVQGQDRMAIKLLCWELEKHLKR